MSGITIFEAAELYLERSVWYSPYDYNVPDGPSLDQLLLKLNKNDVGKIIYRIDIDVYYKVGKFPLHLEVVG